MSVTGAVDLLVEDSLFELTGGTAPMCGVDVRPFCVAFYYHILHVYYENDVHVLHSHSRQECGADVVGCALDCPLRRDSSNPTPMPT